MADNDLPAGKTFDLPLAVSFKHCDPAGMVFYPRYVEMLNDVIEAWFDQGLGCSYQALHVQRGLAIPTVSLNCDFRRPSRLGDRLLAQLDVERLGASSVSLWHRLSNRDDPADVRLTARQVIVFIDSATARPIPVPPDILTPMRTFLLPTGAHHD